MVEHIDRVFKFTASTMRVQGGTEEELIALLYSRPLEFDVQLVHVGVCGCNMGHCHTVRDILLESETTATYGDVLKIVSHDFSHHAYWKDLTQYCRNRNTTYRTCESLTKALEKYELAVDPAQIKKHMYNKAVDQRAHPRWYDYMDSVCLRMEVVTDLPDVFHGDHHDKDQARKSDVRLDPAVTYVRCEWGR